MSWLQSIAEYDNRDAAREKFYEWCEMQASVHDPITFDRKQNDVAYLHITSGGNHFVRDLTQRYGPSACPIRVISVDAVDDQTVELRVLLADLEVSPPKQPGWPEDE